MSIEAYKKALIREKAARESAEKILEGKSLELYNINKNLESIVETRTKALEEATKNAENSNRAKTEFLMKLSHEIRTPVTGIVGFSEMLKEQDSLSAETQGIIKNIYACAALLESLMDDLYDFADIETKSIVLNKEPIRVRSTIRNIEAVIGVQAQVKNLRLETHVSDNVPEYIETDGKRLAQIILNLVTNAVKYTKEGTVSITVDYINNTTLTIDVADSGVGMSKDNFNHIFESFLQLNTSVNGLGLGLNLVKTYIDLLDGKISIKSKEGSGSTFSIKLPAAKTQKITTVQSNKSEPLALDLNILLVEDNLINTKIITSYLSGIAKKVDHATDVSSTKSFLNKNKYDIIILDYFIEGGTAIDCLKNIDSSSTKTLILTANNSEKIKNDCIHHGANLFLSKPIRKDFLLTQITQLFHSEL